MSSTLPRASQRSLTDRSGTHDRSALTPVQIGGGLLGHIDVRALRWLVLGMMGAAALVIPFVANAGHHGHLIAKDSFGRKTTQGWSTADAGGAWSYPQNGQAFSVQHDAGTITLTPGSSAASVLQNAVARDVSLRFTTRLASAPTGNGATVSAVLRRTDSAEYRLEVRFAPEGALASIVRFAH